ncbi:MAG: bifunctional DNA-formamidopyrimidine glycosylase/DNA-(apurinic or apyrimidinic site) lyase [Microthrixaceae bacterium]
MPELPEVETIRRQISGSLTGRRITDGWGFDSAKFSDAPQAVGRRIRGVARRGKYLIADLDSRRELVIHLGMTGRLAVVATPPSEVSDPLLLPRHLRACWELDNGTHLGFWDQRRFGRVAVVIPHRYEEMPTLAALGPEPFSDAFTGEALRSRLSGRKAIKTALLDQRVVAGVGNIYADEALWIAGISPTTRRVGAARAAALRNAIVAVLRAGIEDGGTTLRDYRDAAGDQGRHQERLRCYGRAGKPCDRCDKPLSRKVVDGRGTTWCKYCQT